MFRYLPPYKPNQLACGTGQTAVVTGWTLKQAVISHLQSYEYAVVGQLYSPTRGLNVLIRNLLANPHVRYLVALDATREDRNAGAVRCLLDFFESGFERGESDTGRECWIVRSPVAGYLDPELPATILEQVRAAIAWERAEAIAAAVERVQAIAQLDPLPVWGEAREFPMAEGVPSVLPGPRYGHRIEGKTIADTWVKIVHRIKTTGVVRPTAYDGFWQELVDLVAVVTDEPPAFHFPEPNYLPIDRAFLDSYIAQVMDDAPHRDGVKYTYGQRLRSWFGRDQIEQAIAKLVCDSGTARAVMSLWDVRDHDAGDSPPCLNHIWVRIGDRELSLTATFRSNDMFSAWPANAMGLRALQQHICTEVARRGGLELQLGPLVTVSQSAHIYDDCWDNAERLVSNHYASLHAIRDYDDPSGSFAIALDGDGAIVVEHLTPGSGEVTRSYRSRTAMQLYRKLAADFPALDVEHALYLGTELQKAETAARTGQSNRYVQDRPLRLDFPV
ncbi:thymidylate synthase [Rubidibacter lacunae]|nr:thymidylate synthase [Rubidibacter lacunae]